MVHLTLLLAAAEEEAILLVKLAVDLAAADLAELLINKVQLAVMNKAVAAVAAPEEDLQEKEKMVALV
jgi:hypothetical protein